MRRARAALIVIISLCSAVAGQELSTDVIQSEDELYLWWQQGIIDRMEYERLREIMLSGIDSTTSHWLDYIPNLSWFLRVRSDIQTDLERRQQQAFEEELPTQSARFQGRARYRLAHRLDSSDRVRQYLWVSLNGASDWHASVRLQRESDGDERLAQRGLRWRPASSRWLREIVLGSFSRRLGLGTVVGYRGRLLDHSERLNGDAVLYPQYGGSNGLFTDIRLGPYSLSMVLSRQRGIRFGVTTIASEVVLDAGKLRPRLVAGYTRLSRRDVDSLTSDAKLALGGRYRYGNGYLDGEAAIQLDSRSGPAAIVFEGKHRFNQAQVEYSGWGYGDAFTDLASGSRAAAMSRRDSLPAAGFGVTSRRRGQEGLLVRTIVMPAERWRMSSSVLAASFDRSFVNLQFLGTLSRALTSSASVELRYLNRTRRRPGNEGERSEGRIQVEADYDTERLDSRVWIGYNTTSSRVDYLSLFGEMEAYETSLGQLHLYGRVSEFTLEPSRLVRWYVFARLGQPIADGVTFAVKLAHQYNRRSSSPHLNLITLEVEGRW